LLRDPQDGRSKVGDRFGDRDRGYGMVTLTAATTSPGRAHGGGDRPLSAFEFLVVRGDTRCVVRSQATEHQKPEFTGPLKICSSAMTCGYYRTSSPVTALR